MKQLLIKNTVEITKQDAGQEFSFGDLRMKHQDCFGGKIKIEHDNSCRQALLICKRCGFSERIFKDDLVKIINTAVLGNDFILEDDVHEEHMKFVQMNNNS